MIDKDSRTELMFRTMLLQHLREIAENTGRIAGALEKLGACMGKDGLRDAEEA